MPRSSLRTTSRFLPGYLITQWSGGMNKTSALAFLISSYLVSLLAYSALRPDATQVLCNIEVTDTAEGLEFDCKYINSGCGEVGCSPVEDEFPNGDVLWSCLCGNNPDNDPPAGILCQAQFWDFLDDEVFFDGPVCTKRGCTATCHLTTGPYVHTIPCLCN